MKKLFILFLVVSSTISVAQESVVLRVKYKKGDKFLMKMNQTMTSTGMLMANNMDMATEVLDNEKNVFTLETKIIKVAMNIMQGTNQMSYDSSKKNDDLDQMGQMLKTQVDPLLQVIVTTKTDQFGDILENIVTPAVQGSEQLKNQAGISFPKKAVKVGDTWTNENEMQGMKTTTEYKVTKITEEKVFLTASGIVSGAGTGTLKGTFEVDRNTGVTLKSVLDTDINAQGQDMKVGVEITMEKI